MPSIGVLIFLGYRCEICAHEILCCLSQSMIQRLQRETIVEQVRCLVGKGTMR